MPASRTDPNKKQHILLVDDEKELLHVTSMLVANLGYHVDTASSGQEALAKLDTSSADLVVLDMVMPEMDGVETLRRIKGKNPDQKVIILSAFAEPDKVTAVRSLGILAYVRKPFDLGTISAVLRDALAGKSTEGIL